MPTVELRPAEPRDREYVEALLAENGLPTADLDAALPALFVCESGVDGSEPAESVGGGDPEAADRVGVGGLEVEESVGLLRSVAVEASARGRGYGTAICERLLDRARAEGLESVYLLTTTAEDFFAELGFEPVERERVPRAIRETAEFEGLCPATATCMKNELV